MVDRTILLDGNAVRSVDNADGTVTLKTATGSTYADGTVPGGVNGRSTVEPLGVPLVARQLTATSTSQSLALTSTARRCTMRVRNANVRITIGSSSGTASATTSTFLGQDERVDFALPTTPFVSYIRDGGATADGTIELTELS